MMPYSDLTARREVNRLRQAYARLIASGAMVGTLLAADVLSDGAPNHPVWWGGLALALLIFQGLSLASARLLLGWQRRAIRRKVQPDKRAVMTMNAGQIVDGAPPESPWWMDDSAHTKGATA